MPENTTHGRTAILLIHCPDQPGIIAAVTEFITSNRGNIIYLDQHTDRADKVFYMRVEWDIEEFVIPADQIAEYFNTLHGRRYEMYFKLYFSDYTPRMAIFVSRMSHCLYDLMARYTAGEWNVEVPLIVSNHEDLHHVAEMFDIPFYHIPITKENRVKQAEKTLSLLKEFEVDFCVLARYMQIIPECMIEAYPNRIINIHHSFLPAFVGAKPYHAAYERGVKLIGATSHYVTAELDAGPIIGQDITRISHKDTVEGLVRKGQDLEKIVLSRAVRKHLQRKILTYKNKTVVF
jgi:formyltetrahydrofolate deformylase